MSDDGWKPANTAPYRKVIEVRNSVMKTPVRATRGFADATGVHPDEGFFTSVYTPDDMGGFPSGRLVCAEEWRDLPDTGD